MNPQDRLLELAKACPEWFEKDYSLGQNYRIRRGYYFGRLINEVDPDPALFLYVTHEIAWINGWIPVQNVKQKHWDIVDSLTGESVLKGPKKGTPDESLIQTLEENKN